MRSAFLLVLLIVGCDSHRDPQDLSDAGTGGIAGSGGAAGDGGANAGSAGVSSGGATSGSGGAAGNGGLGGRGGATTGGGGSLGGTSGTGGQAGGSCGGWGGSNPRGSQLQPQGATPAVGCNGGTPPITKPDECGCLDLACRPAETCLRVFEPPPSALGGGGNYFNGCFERCDADMQCGPGRSCAMTVYGIRECVPWVCRQTSECTADSCGRCQLGYNLYHVGTWMLNEAGNTCVYEGPCTSSSCANCTPYGMDSHRCP